MAQCSELKPGLRSRCVEDGNGRYLFRTRDVMEIVDGSQGSLDATLSHVGKTNDPIFLPTPFNMSIPTSLIERRVEDDLSVIARCVLFALPKPLSGPYIPLIAFLWLRNEKENITGGMRVDIQNILNQEVGDINVKIKVEKATEPWEYRPRAKVRSMLKSHFLQPYLDRMGIFSTDSGEFSENSRDFSEDSRDFSEDCRDFPEDSRDFSEGSRTCRGRIMRFPVELRNLPRRIYHDFELKRYSNLAIARTVSYITHLYMAANVPSPRARRCRVYAKENALMCQRLDSEIWNGDSSFYLPSSSQYYVSDALFACTRAANLSTSTPRHVSTSTPQHVSTSTPQHVSTSTPQHVSTSTPQHVSTSTPQHVSTSTPQHVSTSTPQHVSTSTPRLMSTATTRHVSTSTTRHVSTSTTRHVSTWTLAWQEECLSRSVGGLLREPERGHIPYDAGMRLEDRLERFDSIPWQLFDLNDARERAGLSRVSFQQIQHKVIQLYHRRAQLYEAVPLVLPSLGMLHQMGTRIRTRLWCAFRVVTATDAEKWFRRDADVHERYIFTQKTCKS
ncbi:hypothetical protein AAMO2058_001295100 [Amorphochlora amoebiformis]